MCCLCLNSAHQVAAAVEFRELQLQQDQQGINWPQLIAPAEGSKMLLVNRLTHKTFQSTGIVFFQSH
jgi:hypothetical protein